MKADGCKSGESDADYALGENGNVVNYPGKWRGWMTPVGILPAVTFNRSNTGSGKKEGQFKHSESASSCLTCQIVANPGDELQSMVETKQEIVTVKFADSVGKWYIFRSKGGEQRDLFMQIRLMQTEELLTIGRYRWSCRSCGKITQADCLHSLSNSNIVPFKDMNLQRWQEMILNMWREDLKERQRFGESSVEPSQMPALANLWPPA